MYKWCCVNIFSHGIEQINHDPIQIQIDLINDTNIIEKTADKIFQLYPYVDVKKFIHNNPKNITIHSDKFVNIFY